MDNCFNTPVLSETQKDSPMCPSISPDISSDNSVDSCMNCKQMEEQHKKEKEEWDQRHQEDNEFNNLLWTAGAKMRAEQKTVQDALIETFEDDKKQMKEKFKELERKLQKSENDTFGTTNNNLLNRLPSCENENTHLHGIKRKIYGEVNENSIKLARFNDENSLKNASNKENENWLKSMQQKDEEIKLLKDQMNILIRHQIIASENFAKERDEEKTEWIKTLQQKDEEIMLLQEQMKILVSHQIIASEKPPMQKGQYEAERKTIERLEKDNAYLKKEIIELEKENEQMVESCKHFNNEIRKVLIHEQANDNEIKSLEQQLVRATKDLNSKNETTVSAERYGRLCDRYERLRAKLDDKTKEVEQLEKLSRRK